MVRNEIEARVPVLPAAEFPTSGYAIPKIYATLHLGRLVDRRLGDTKLIVGVENILDTAYRDASTFANLTNDYRQTLTNPPVEVGRNFTAKLQHTFWCGLDGRRRNQ